MKKFDHTIIKRRREYWGVSLREFAEELNELLKQSDSGIGKNDKKTITHETVRNWENGKFFPSAAYLPVLAKGLVISISSFYK